MKRHMIRFALAPLELVIRHGQSRYSTSQRVLALTPPRLLAKLGEWRAVRAADHAVRRVPAYRSFSQEHGISSADVSALRLPFTDKRVYVDRYGLIERCVDGRLPHSGAAIDESSGSSGTPYNWIRSADERETSQTMVSHFARYLYGDGLLVTINAFSMGAWAKATSVGLAGPRNGIVKNTGPDVDSILATLEFLGTDHRYLVCGYPPFVKRLIDAARERGFPLADYTLAAAVGGEGMSEGLRDYLSTHFAPVYSGYGATDVEVGLGGETPLTVAVRRLAWKDPRVRRAVFGDDPRLPMLFQYNPLNHHVTVTDDAELVFTINRMDILSPRIAYNIHDEGGVTTYAELRQRLLSAGVDIDSLTPAGGRSVRLPFLWVYGRKDSTVSVMGANIYPEDVEQALYDLPQLAAVTNSFCLGLEEQSTGEVRPCFSFEVRSPLTDALVSEFERGIIERMTAINADFRVAMGEHRLGVLPVIRLHGIGQGPFGRDGGRIKQTRIVSAPRASDA